MILAAPAKAVLVDSITPEQLRDLAVAVLALAAFAAVVVLIELRRRRHGRGSRKAAPTATPRPESTVTAGVYHAPRDAPVPISPGSPVVVQETPPPEPTAPLPTALGAVEVLPSRPDEIGIVLPDPPALGAKPPETPER